MRILGLAVLLLASPAAAQELSPEAAEAAVRAFLAAPSGPNVAAASAGNVSVAGDTVSLDAFALDLDLPDGDGGSTRVTLSAPVALIDGLARTVDGWQADAIRLPEASWVSADGGSSEGIGRIELNGPSWPAAVALPATEGPAAAFEPLLGFFAAVSADGAVLESADGDLRLGAVENGRIATLEAEVKVGDGAAEKPAKLALEGFDVGAIADVMFANGGEPQVALAKLTITDIESDGTDVSGEQGTAGEPAAEPASPTVTSLASFSIEGIRLTPQSPPLAARIDDVAAVTKASASAPVDPNADPAAPAPPPSPEEVDLGLAVWQAIAVDLVAMDGMRSSKPETDETFTVDRIAVANIGAGRDLDITADDMVVDLPEGERVTIARLALLGVRVPESRFMREAILAGSTPPAPDVIVGNLPIIRKIALEKLAGETKEGVRFTIDEAAVEMGGHINNIPTELASTTRGTVDLDDAIIPDDPSGAALVDELRARGLSKLEFSGGDRFRWNDGKLAYEGKVAVEKLGSYALDLTMSGIPRYVFEDPARIAEVVAFLSLDSFNVAVTDHGAVGLMRDFIARQQPGGDIDAELARGLNEIEFEVAAALGPDTGRIVATALATFAAGGHSLTLAGTPPRPVPVTQLGVAALAPRAIVDLLGLKLTTAPAPN